MKKIYKFLFRGPTEFLGPIVMFMIFGHLTMELVFFIIKTRGATHEDEMILSFVCGYFFYNIGDSIIEYFKRIGKE